VPQEADTGSFLVLFPVEYLRWISHFNEELDTIAAEKQYGLEGMIETYVEALSI
jgi:hypothetical protein